MYLIQSPSFLDPWMIVNGMISQTIPITKCIHSPLLKTDFRGFELLNCLCYAKEHRLRSNSILHFSVHLIVFNVYVMSRSMLLWVQLQFRFDPYSSHCNGLMIWWITEIGVWSKSNICIHWNHSTNIYVEYFWLYTEWLIQSNSVLHFYYS